MLKKSYDTLVFVLLKVFSLNIFLFTPPTQDVHAYVMTGRIIAVYIHRMLVGFNPHAVPTICLQFHNATVALRAIRVM